MRTNASDLTKSNHWQYSRLSTANNTLSCRCCPQNCQQSQIWNCCLGTHSAKKRFCMAHQAYYIVGPCRIVWPGRVQFIAYNCIKYMRSSAENMLIQEISRCANGYAAKMHCTLQCDAYASRQLRIFWFLVARHLRGTGKSIWYIIYSRHS